MTKAAAIIALLTLCACGRGVWQNLPKEDKSAWERCWPSVKTSQCYSAAGVASDLECHRLMVNKYNAAQDRPGWLVQHGCPASVAR